jgi:hypothetical protein
LLYLGLLCLGQHRLSHHFGASAIGLVAKMPSGQGLITDDLISKIAKSVPPPIFRIDLHPYFSSF